MEDYPTAQDTYKQAFTTNYQNVMTMPKVELTVEETPPEYLEDKDDVRESLLDRLSEFVHDDMEEVLDYLDENGSPVVEYVSSRVGDIMEEVSTTMEHSPGEASTLVPPQLPSYGGVHPHDDGPARPLHHTQPDRSPAGGHGAHGHGRTYVHDAVH